MQINGTILSFEDGNLLTLRTAAGEIAVKIAAGMPSAPNNPVASLLTPFAQNQRPVGLAIQPGAPPKDALLLLPHQETRSPFAPLKVSVSSFATSGQTFASGTVVNALPLPSGLIHALTTASLKDEGLIDFGLKRLTMDTAAALPQAAKSPSLSGFYTSQDKVLVLKDSLLNAEQGPAHPSPSSQGISSLPASPTNTSKAVVQENAPHPVLRAGVEIQLRIDAFSAPKSPTVPVREGQIEAFVIGKGPDGQLLLNADGNVLYIRESSTLPVGSRLLLTVLPRKDEREAFVPLGYAADAPALFRAMNALAQVDPSITQRLLEKHFPQPNASLPGALLFLFNALQQGGIQGWLGHQASELLSTPKQRKILAELVEEMGQAGAPAKDSASGQWRSWPIPLYDTGQLEILRLYVRKDGGRHAAGGATSGEAKTRFLINMNLTRLGAMQMDGLSQNKQLDLVIRSEKRLPTMLPAELRELYITTIEALGLTGSLSFQTGRKGWISVQAESIKKTGVVT